MNTRQITFLAFPAILFAGTVIDTPQIVVEPPTFNSIGFQILHGGDDNRNASVGLRYRNFGSAVWRNAQPLIRVPVERVTWKALPRQFAGSIFDLRPGVNYEYELSISDPDGFTQTTFGTARTRALPVAAANPRSIAVAGVAGLLAAVAAAQPGDVITLQPGVYPVQYLSFANSATAANPITLRGSAVDTVILDGQDCGCNVIEVWGSYIRIESLTIRNALQAIRYFGASTGNQFTRNIVTNVEKAINSQAGQSGFLIADNRFEGRLAYIRPSPAVPDSYAFQVYGSDHILAHNEIRGFADGMRLFGEGNRNVDIYGNDILYSADDGIELDQSDGNIRVQRNRISNIDSGISTQPVSGGPAYLMRNVILNAANEQIKFHANGGPPPRSPSGVYVYQNTLVSATRGLTVSTVDPGYDSHFRNNIFHGPLAATEALAWEAPLFNVTFNNNGYFPDGRAYWKYQGTYVDYPNIAAVRAGGLFEGTGFALSGNVFLSGLIGPANSSVYLPPQIPLLSPAGNGVNAAMALSNVNDLYAGSAADLGALESGCPSPSFGPRPVGIDESNEVRGCPDPAAAGNAAPVNVGVSPLGRSGSPYVFTASVTDFNGASDLESITLLFGPSIQLPQACAIIWKRSTGGLYLYSNTGSGLLGPIQPGSAQTLSNSRCSINGATSQITQLPLQNMVRVSAGLAFAPSFRNLKNVYLNSLDLSSASSGWTLHGTWR